MVHKLRITAVSTSFIGAAVFGVMLVQPATFASTTNTTINSTISSTISLLSSSGTVTINAAPISGTPVQTVASDTVTVSTNDSLGYILKLNSSSASTASLASGGNTIPVTAGTQAAPVAMSTNSWGYRVDSVGGFGAGPTSSATNAAVSAAKYAPVPLSASPDTIKTTAATASSDTTTVWYGVAVNTTQPSGAYTGTVVYTATAN